MKQYLRVEYENEIENVWEELTVNTLRAILLQSRSPALGVIMAPIFFVAMGYVMWHLP